MRDLDQRGFTLVELVMTLVILGILSATAMPRFFDFSAFRQRAFFDDTLAAVRYAQKLAVATGCNVQFSIAADRFRLMRPGATDRSQCASTAAADFTLDVARPGSGEAVYQGSQTGIAVDSATVYFTAKGLASADLDIAVGDRRISIVKDTGFVYDSSP
ncbi:MAG: prepilin-type N-terminal cleavage/methylation domain-containing protein [Methylomonas sp.]|nr:prepilin-type N-terminal cleavage/methylation domain-containing protein [Methylomonas sp.]